MPSDIFEDLPPSRESTAKPAQSAQDPIELAITAAEISSIKTQPIREQAATALADELRYASDWKKILQLGKALEPAFNLPVVSCGRPLANAKDESIAKSFVQGQEIEDSYVRASVDELLNLTLKLEAIEVEKNLVQALTLEQFELRLTTLSICNEP